MGSPHRVGIAEDETILREVLRAILTGEDEFQVVFEAADGREALQLAELHHPEILLLDLMMPRMNGLEAIREIKRISPDTRILILTVHQREDYLFSALKAGADGYLLKSAGACELRDAIRTVLGGQRYLSSQLLTRVIDGFIDGDGAVRPRSVIEHLSAREREILKLIAEGYKTRQIAEALCISPKTVENHRVNLMKKLGLRGIQALTAYAIKTGLVDP
jgi:DNA-binding NarL/FixJ family response regulator